MKLKTTVSAYRAAAAFERRWQRLRAHATDLAGTDEGAYMAFRARTMWKHHVRATMKSNEDSCLVAVTSLQCRVFKSGRLADAEQWARRMAPRNDPRWRVLIAEGPDFWVEAQIHALGAYPALAKTVEVSSGSGSGTGTEEGA